MFSVIGIDPGHKGAAALVTVEPVVTANSLHLAKLDHEIVDWSDPQRMITKLSEWSCLNVIVRAGIEKVHGHTGNAIRSNTTFMLHTGWWHGVVDSLDLPRLEILPRTWQQHFKLRTKRNHRDKPSMDYMAKHYPYVNLHGPRGGQKDGRADAFLIALYTAYRCVKDPAVILPA